MGLKYNLTLHELMNFFLEQDYEGYTEQELQAAEKAVGIKLPSVYCDFLLKYGEGGVYDNLFTTQDELCTSYEMIHETLEDLEGDFEEAERNGNQEEYADNPYFSLWHMPEEDWHTITQNYLLVGCDSQGISYSGYLVQDLLDGKNDPPVYISLDDDIIEFKKWTDNTEDFLIEMLCETAWENNYSNDYNPEKRMSVKEIFAYMNVDIDEKKLKVSGHVGTCLDTAGNKLYIYFDYGDFQRIFFVCKE